MSLRERVEEARAECWPGRPAAGHRVLMAEAGSGTAYGAAAYEVP